LGGLEGVFSVVDNVFIAGCGQTVEEAQIDNQRKLTETLKRSAKNENDQKSLAAILRKPLSQASKRLQDLMMRYHRYDVNFAFVKGTD